MAYLLNNNELPWCNFAQGRGANGEKLSFKNMLKARLQSSNACNVIKLTPKSIRPVIMKVWTLRFE